MTPVNQTVIGPRGDCFSACVASLLDLPAKAVPLFVGERDPDAALAAWLKPRGFYSAVIPLADAWRPSGLYILVGKVPRAGAPGGVERHAVVAEGSRILHDPHPTRAGVRTHESATLLVQLVPRNDLSPAAIQAALTAHEARHRGALLHDNAAQ